MNSHSNARAVAAALVGVMLVGTTAHALADIKNYRFEVVDKAMKVAPDAVITVKLVNTTTGKSVPDAVIFATRLDMEPEGMKDMATRLIPVPGAEPGLYRFQAKVVMAGHWRLSLGAKIQGEQGTVDQKLVIEADE